MVTLNIEGKKVKVDDGFLSMSPEQQEATVEEIAASLGVQKESGGGVMANFNRGAADVFDAVNPFNAARAGLNALTGSDLPTDVSARRQLPEFGINVDQGKAEGLVENFARGSGTAAAALPLITTGAGLLSTSPRALTANVADDVYRGLASKGGAVAEVAAGGISQTAGQVADDAGYPGLRPYAEIAAPIAAGGAAIGAGKLAGATLSGAERLPVAGAAVRVGRQAIGALGPMTGPGARQQAREQLLREVGSEARATELGGRIERETELGLTPAQQTGDPNLLSLERAAASEQPEIREALTVQDARARATAEGSIDGMSGDVSDARSFFKTRLSDFKTRLQEKSDIALQMGDESVAGVGPRSSESAASSNVTAKLKLALDDAKVEEDALWRQVPQDETFEASGTLDTFDDILQSTARAQQSDIPQIAKQILGEGSALRDTGRDNVMELHGLYSELRRVARSAMAGNDKNANKARIANKLAESILTDLGAVAGDNPTGQAINEARAYSAALHETFDQGTVGRILNRTIDGDETIPSESALRRTVGRGGSDALVDNANIAKASPGAKEDVADYIRGRFSDSIVGPDGKFSPKTGAAWLRKNREILNQYPELRSEMYRAMGNRQKAEAFSARAKVRSDLADKSAIEGFNRGQEQKALSSILTADSPVKAARSVVATARKDASGKALAGVKAAFTDYLIGSATKGSAINGKDVVSLLSDGQTAAAMRVVFTPAELARFKRIGSELAKLDAASAATPKGPVMDAAPMMLIDTVARIAGAKAGAKVAGGGGAGVSLQAAQLGSRRARDLLGRMTNDKARRILYDAVQDPELMRALLLQPKGAELPAWAVSKITPYLTGAAAQTIQ